MQASITSEKIVCLPEARTCSSAVLACFRLTQAEYSLMLACASGLKPSECTASQRRTLQELENRLYAKRIEYPRLLKGQSWVLTGTGQAFGAGQ